MALTAAAALLSVSVTARAADPNGCEALRCDTSVADAIGHCPCPDAGNHGAYVSCIAKAINKLAKDGGIPKNCKGRVKSCAAKSICGKPGFVTCQVPKELGTCGTPCAADAGTTCCEDATTPCAADTDCVISSVCKIKKAERCAAIPGAVQDTATTCCAACAPPPGS